MRGKRSTAVIWGLVVLAGVIGRCVCRREDHGPRPARFATFNIEDFPKDRRQVDGAFTLIGELGVDFVAVQEIGDPGLFQRAAQRHLGGSWGFVHADTAPLGAAPHASHHIGVLYDRRVHSVRSTTVHDGTRLGAGRHKPTLEVRLAPRDGGPILRVFVLHLKAGSEGRDVRRQQYAALARILRASRASGSASGERIVVLGDFNATEPSDRDDLAALARGSGLVWATEPLACSAFWERVDDCPTSRLDHVLTWSRPAQVVARGACAEGCALRDRCPVYRHEISDHCPVTVAIDPD